MASTNLEPDARRELAAMSLAGSDEASGSASSSAPSSMSSLRHVDQVLSDSNLAQLVLTSIPPKPLDGWLGLARSCRCLRDEAHRCGLRLAAKEHEHERPDEQVCEFTEVFNLFAMISSPDRNRQFRKSVRELERERTGLERHERKLIADIKRAAKNGQIDATKKMSNELMRTRNNIKKMLKMKSHLLAAHTGGAVATADLPRLMRSCGLNCPSVGDDPHGDPQDRLRCVLKHVGVAPATIAAGVLHHPEFLSVMGRLVSAEARDTRLTDVEVEELMGDAKAREDGERWRRPGRFSFDAVRKIMNR